MIQGGCPIGNGTGGPGYNIKGEFTANGVNNTISHVRGVISMARAMSYNSGGSQFFIMHKDGTYLDVTTSVYKKAFYQYNDSALLTNDVNNSKQIYTSILLKLHFL